MKQQITTLGNLDLAVEIIRLPNRNFYDGFKTARKIVETSAGNLTLKGQANEKKTGAPIKGVTFTFRSIGMMAGSSGNGEIIKKTADKGKFNIKNMPAGTYQVTVNKPGYAEKTETVIVAEGDLTDLKVELERL
ncbi:MAG: carboxypeptidase regulatory-like domain-containing protein [Bacteroidales bacterium]|nr:carboxypeptidase regulatory-like domain-containing protein [Bacteroidales bacterium]